MSAYLDRISRDRNVWRQAVAQVAAALVSLGVITVGIQADVIDTTDSVADLWTAAAPVVQLLAGLLGAAWAKRHVTPTDDPQTDDGTPLVPVPETPGGAVR